MCESGWAVLLCSSYQFKRKCLISVPNICLVPGHSPTLGGPKAFCNGVRWGQGYRGLGCPRGVSSLLGCRGLQVRPLAPLLLVRAQAWYAAVAASKEVTLHPQELAACELPREPVSEGPLLVCYVPVSMRRAGSPTVLVQVTHDGRVSRAAGAHCPTHSGVCCVRCNRGQAAQHGESLALAPTCLTHWRVFLPF